MKLNLNNYSVKVNRVKDSECEKYLKTKSEENGHDCWGKLEWTSRDYVMVKGKQSNVYDGTYLIHDGEKVLEVCYSEPDEYDMEKYATEEYKKELKLEADRREYNLYLKLHKKYSK